LYFGLKIAPEPHTKKNISLVQKYALTDAFWQECAQASIVLRQNNSKALVVDVDVL
jgi:hypothetical protein